MDQLGACECEGGSSDTYLASAIEGTESGYVHRWGEYTGWALRATQGRLRDIQTGRHYAYAAVERGETGKSNDLCSSWSSQFRSLNCYKNSDLRSKWNNGTSYILLATPSK